MRLDGCEVARRTAKSACVVLGLAGVLTVTGLGARAQAPRIAPEDEQQQTFFLHYLTEQNEFNDLQTDLRSMIPRARFYGMPAEDAISMEGTPEEIARAQKLIAEFDRPRQSYRLTFTFTDMENGKRTGAHQATMIAPVGWKTTLRLGNKVPIATGATEGKSGQAPQTEFQYVDVGLSVVATLEGQPEGLRLRSNIEQSSVAEEKPVGGAQDPVIHQSVLDGAAPLTPGKAVVLGSMDVPGTGRSEEIEVTAEAVK
jgi:type II secretory pathway component GspD/PulD (secretin)